MPEATIMDYGALVGKVIERRFPILPQPAWGQDAAFLAFFIDGIVKENQELQRAIGDLWHCIGHDEKEMLQPETQIECRRVHNSL